MISVKHISFVNKYPVYSLAAGRLFIGALSVDDGKDTSLCFPSLAIP